MHTIGELGCLVEGVLERDPLTDRYVIHTSDGYGNNVSRDVQEILAKYLGMEVRFTLASFEDLKKLAGLLDCVGVEEGDGN